MDLNERLRTAATETKTETAGHRRPDVDPEEAAVRLAALMDGLQAQRLLNKHIDMVQQIQAAIHEVLTPTGIDALTTVHVDQPASAS